MILSVPVNASDMPGWVRVAANAINQLIFRGAAAREFTVATLPDPIPAGQIILVTDEAGGEVLAFSDTVGDWRRVTDRAVVS
jgi:hypothetical protein